MSMMRDRTCFSPPGLDSSTSESTWGFGAFLQRQKLPKEPLRQFCQYVGDFYLQPGTENRGFSIILLTDAYCARRKIPSVYNRNQGRYLPFSPDAPQSYFQLHLHF